MKFSVKNTLPNSKARTGQLETGNGVVNTPVFMPVGTVGIVKHLAPWEMRELGAEILLANTYHLHIRPGEKLIEEFGGVGKWSGWNGPILTDSGGYQAFSLSQKKVGLAKITDDGVKFRSHIDGRALYFTPESVVEIQQALKSDIAMILDDCPSFDAPPRRMAKSIERTAQWARRAFDHWHKTDNEQRALFGIVQGGIDEQMRKKSLDDIQNIGFDGIAIGGVANGGDNKLQMTQAVDCIADNLDKTRPHYLMGVGDPDDLVRMIHRGIDMFDCVLATRLGRHGTVWLSNDFSRMDLRRSQFFADSEPLDKDCECKICKNFSRAYLRHLLLSKEGFASRALSYHNLHLLHKLIKDIRRSINDGDFVQKYSKWL